MTDDNKNAEITKVLTGGVRDNIKTIYDKLDTIETISKKTNQTTEERALNQYEIERNNSCYMTLSYVITRELITIDNTLKNMYDYINEIETEIKKEEIQKQIISKTTTTD